MKAVLFGASGMVGKGVLLECLEDPRVTSVVAVNRSSAGVSHPKVREVLHRDFQDFTALQPAFEGADACFFCLGVTSAGMNEADYSRITVDIAAAAGRSLLAASDHLTMCFVSGAGTDSSERGRVMWARVKGRAENALRAMPFQAAYMFRPALIQPLKGVRSKTALYQAFYTLAAPLTPVLRRLAPGSFTTSVDLGRAMIRVALHGYPAPILHSADINRAARLP